MLNCKKALEKSITAFIVPIKSIFQKKRKKKENNTKAKKHKMTDSLETIGGWVLMASDLYDGEL